MKFNVEFENMVTHEKWTIEVDAADEAAAETIAETMIANMDGSHVMFEVRDWC